MKKAFAIRNNRRENLEIDNFHDPTGIFASWATAGCTISAPMRYAHYGGSGSTDIPHSSFQAKRLGCFLGLLPDARSFNRLYRPVADELGQPKGMKEMVKTLELTDANENVIGTYDQHFQLNRKYHRNGAFVTRDGRRYDLVWRAKWYDNIVHF